MAAHGIAGQKDMGLEPFAELFASKGMAVLLFDYRNFGGSEGEPRNWVSPKRHLQDWDAALDYVRVCCTPMPACIRCAQMRSECDFLPGSGQGSAEGPCCDCRAQRGLC